MKSGWFRDRDGRQRLWLSDADIETMMGDELHRARLLPSVDHPVVDLERFLEGHLGAQLDQHAVLESGVLGQTEFFLGQPPHVAINRDLTGAAMDDDDGDPGVLGRWRATLAHEASHILMHRILFELNQDDADLFGAGPTVSARLMRCLKPNVLFRGGGSDWREVQANLGMAALLMPRGIFAGVVERALQRRGVSRDVLSVDPHATAAIVHEVATTMRVSRKAAAIRMETLNIIDVRGQAILRTAQ